MVIAYHAIFSTYGFWLPNDPRGSGSSFVGSKSLYDAGGKATKVSTTHSVAGVPHNRQLRFEVKKALKYPTVKLTGVQALAVGLGFKKYVAEADLLIRACSIMPDHVHIVAERARMSIEQMVIHLKGEASIKMHDDGIHPFQNIVLANGRHPKCFERDFWKVFIDNEDQLRNAIAYVEQNPIKAGLPPQNWSFVKHV